MKRDTLRLAFASARGKVIAGSLAALVALSPMALGSAAYAEDSRSQSQTAETITATSPHEVGRVLYADIRIRDDEFVKHAPGAASSGRVSVIVYGGSDPLLRAVYEAAQTYAASGPNRDIYFLQASDNDDDPNTVNVTVWSNGRKHRTIIMENADKAEAQDFADLTSRAKQHMDGARSEHLAQLSAPQLASADPG